MTTQIDPKDLYDRLQNNVVKVIDGSWALDGTDMRALFMRDHIPGAQFLDIEDVSDHSTPLPHMAPSPTQFAHVIGAIGISHDDHVVIYDRQGLFSAARIWWLFTLMGHRQVQVLRGGLPAWKTEGLPLTSEVTTPASITYRPEMQSGKVISMNALRARLHAPHDTILDARSAGRFTGEAPEPRSGLRGGHVPGSRNLPFNELIQNGALKPEDDLRAIFARLGVDQDKTVITTCGSGVTAAIISMALAEVGHTSALLYDGSWSEWGQETLDTPVETGDHA